MPCRSWNGIFALDMFEHLTRLLCAADFGCSVVFILLLKRSKYVLASTHTRGVWDFDRLFEYLKAEELS